MGIYDRDYIRHPKRSSMWMGIWSVTTWLIVINVAVFLIDQLLFRADVSYLVQFDTKVYRAPPLFGLGHFSVFLAIQKFEVWRFITCQFLHAGLLHLALNMLGLFFFAPMVESYLGRARFIAFYLLCGIAGPVAYIVLWLMQFLIGSSFTTLVGASAGFFGILIAAAQVAPDTTVLVYGIMPIKLRTLAWVLLVVAAYTVLQFGHSAKVNAGGEAAHLGGAAVGYLLISNSHWLRVPDLNFLRRRRPPF